MKIDYKYKGLNTIQDIRTYLFRRAKHKQLCSFIFGMSALLLIVLPLIFNIIFDNLGIFTFVFQKDLIPIHHKLQTISSFLVTVCTILQWLCRYQAIRWNTEAREMGNYELIYNLSNRRRIGELAYKRLPNAMDKEKIYSFYDENKEYYTSPKEINIYQETSYRILENCIWNRYLLLKMYGYQKNNLWWAATGISLALLLITQFCPYSFSSFFYLINLVAVSSLTFNYIETLHSAKSVISPIESLIKELMSIRIDTSEKFQTIYNAYSHINLKSPNISDNLYLAHRDKLNKMWTELRQKLPASDITSSINSVLPIIKNLLDSNGIDWAITGSASKVIRGGRKYCRDIDIIIANRKNLEKVNSLFKPFIIEEVIFCPSKSIRSYYGKLNIGGINIDVVCDIENLISTNCWIPHPSLEIEKVCFHGVKYPITSLGFEKKVAKIIAMKD